MSFAAGLLGELQDVDRLLRVLAANQIRHQADLLRRGLQVPEPCREFHDSFSLVLAWPLRQAFFGAAVFSAAFLPL